MTSAKDRSWKIVYGATRGPEGRALELLASEVGAIHDRDPGVYTLNVLPCERAGSGEVPDKWNAILVGTPSGNPEIAPLLNPGDVPAGGYLVRTIDMPDGSQRVVVAGDTPEATLWAVDDFLDEGLNALAVRAGGDGHRYRSKIFEQKALGRYESRRAPRTPIRSVFTWAHVIDDFREYFRNLARLRFNEVILWNNRPPVNAAEIVEYAHSWGIRVLWGFAWGWSTNCRNVDMAHLDRLEDDILREWRSVWRPLGGDGIYFQSFTELDQEDLGGKSIAATVVELVNRVSTRIRSESPGLRIVFGLHARSVRNRLAEIDGTDPSVEILWEDCGGFPFNYAKPFDPRGDAALVDSILAEDREVGIVLKCGLLQDWTRFVYQAGPYVLGCASTTVKEEDARTAEELWRPYCADWQTRGRVAYDVVRQIQSARPGRPSALNVAINANGRVRFPLALLAELFWSADEPYETLLDRVARRTWVGM